MRAGGGADAIERVGDIGHPVAQRLVHRVLQRARAGLDRAHLGAQQLHAEDVRLLPLDVDRAHVDDAVEAEAGADGRGGDAVLARAGLGDDALLAHAAGEQDLAEHVVDLVRAGVVELVALEIDLRAAEPLGQPLGEIERARPADVVLEEVVELGLERRVGLRLLVGLLQREDQRHQRLGDEAAAVDAEAAALVRALAEGVGLVELGHSLSSFGRAGKGRARGGDEGRDLVSSLIARRALDARRHVDAARPASARSPRRHCRDRGRRRAATARVGEKPRARRQSKGRPLPPGSDRAFGRLGVDQEKVGRAVVARGGGEVVRRRDADRLHRRAAEPPADRLHPRRRFAAMQLQDVGVERLDDARRARRRRRRR